MAKVKAKKVLDTTGNSHQYKIAFRKTADMKSPCPLCDIGYGCLYYLKPRKAKHGTRKPKSKNKRRVKKKD